MGSTDHKLSGDGGIILWSWTLCILVASGFLTGCGVHSAETAGQSVDYLSVPDGFTVEQVAGPELVDFPTFATFDDEGRLFVIESTRANTMTTDEMREDPHHRIKVLEDVDGDGVYDQSTVFADSLAFPEGGTWHQGSFYVASAPHLLRFEDSDKDLVADSREVVLEGWTLYVNGALLSGPFVGPDGWFYMADARRGFEITTKEGEIIEGAGARIWRVQPDGSRLESMSGGGFDNAIEIVFTPAGETIGTMTYFVDPHAGQRDALMHWIEGGVYPKPHSVIEEDGLTRTGELMPVMTKLARISHSGLYRYEHPYFGDDYQGNLFSAQFNTGRVMRHEMSRTGATFETEESKFLTSTDPDFHPTDVLADADGSLLVVDTGGWFIEGCPLSQVAKPDIPGGIYRIRKTDGTAVDDPWGRSINMENIPPEELVEYVTDRRPKVREQAIEHLVGVGTDAVDPLREMLEVVPSEEARTSAVFALYRIGTSRAMEGVRQGLSESSSQVRNAAVRSAGLARDRQSTERLMEIVQTDKAPVRRQAATALGQIGDPAAVPALLKAAEDSNDRFVEHAVIYSLIELGQADPLLQALTRQDPDARTSALIALDQMEDSPLRRSHVEPFLMSQDQKLHEAGVWVVSRHSEWSDLVREFLGERLRTEILTGEQEESAAQLAVSFCEDAEIQQLMGDLLEEPAVSADRRELLLGAIDRCSVEELPEKWVWPIGRLLRAENTAVRSQALELVRSRGLEALAGPLEEIAGDEGEDLEVRMETLSALVTIRPQLSDQQFELLTGQLDPGAEAPIRQSAAYVLTQADLTGDQLVHLAEYHVAEADAVMLSKLIGAYEAEQSERVGTALIEALDRSSERLENLSIQDLEELMASYPESIQKAARPLIERLREQQKNRLERLEELEARLTEGDVGDGREIFFGDKVICSSCHAVGGEGGDFGPDLTNIGEIRSRHDLLEAIMYPSVSFAREYETYEVETTSSTRRGVIVEQTPEMVLLQTGPESRMRIPRDEILSIEETATSMMPPGLEQALTVDELSDLMAFLESLPRASRLEQ